MKQSARVRKSDCFRNAVDHAGRLPRRQRVVTGDIGEAAAFDKVHGEIELAVLLAHFMDSDDIWMIQAGGHLRLPAKAFDECGMGKMAAGKHFDCDQAVEANLSRAVNDSHAT